MLIGSLKTVRQIQILLRYGLSDVTGIAVNQHAILCQNTDSWTTSVMAWHLCLRFRLLLRSWQHTNHQVLIKFWH